MSRFSIILTILFGFIISGFAQLPTDIQQIHRKIRRFEKERFLQQLPYLSKTPTPNQRLFDIHSYTLNLSLWPTTQLLDGSVRILGESLTGSLTHIEIDLFSNMQVDSVLQDGALLSYTHTNDLIDIQLNGGVGTGGLFEVEIYYHGNPQSGGLGTWGWDYHQGNPIIWTLSEPFGAPAWWPCKDDPADKADSVFVNATVPNSLVVASNGLLQAVNPAGTGRHTYSWETHYPISTYLVSLAISNYAEFNDWYVSLTGDSMELRFFVYPEHLTAAQQDLSITSTMIGAYAGIFGEYPFLNEKYGMAIFPWGGAMEHQTITSYGAGLITGNHHYDWINAHELSHQWFGDCITMRGWSHIWLNEGFASYAEALWAEYTGGSTAYHNYMLSQDPGSFSGSIFVFDSTNVNSIFSNTVYDKGSWALHMLRGILGDSLFFAGLKAYATDPAYAYGNAVTEDFRDELESVSGMDLDWYFDEWIYQPGRPNYVYNWAANGTTSPYTTTLLLNQANPAPYKMPLQIRLSAAGWDTTFTIWDSLASQQFQFVTDTKPTNLQVDPDNWVLKHLTSGNAYSVTGTVVDIADSSTIPNAYVIWEGPYDPNTGAPLNFGIDSTDIHGNFQLLLLDGDYALVAFKDSFVTSEIHFYSIHNPISGVVLALSQPQAQFSIDSLQITLNNTQVFDTTLIIQNMGTGDLFVQSVEGDYSTTTFRNRAPLLSRQFPLADLLKPRSAPQNRAVIPIDSLWQQLHHDAQENAQNVYDVENTFIQENNNIVYFKLTTYQQPPTYSTMRINIFIDADDDLATGLNITGMGAEYLVAIGDFGGGYYGYLLQWNPSTQNYDFLGFVDYFSANTATKSIVLGINAATLGDPDKINIYYPAYDQNNFPFSIDYVPSSNLGYLSASLLDVPWLQVDPLFDLANADSAAALHIQVDPANVGAGSYHSGITLHTTAPDVMLRHFIPISLDLLTGIAQPEPMLPRHFALQQNYPNPFNPSTTIRYALPQTAKVDIAVYNILGQKIAGLQPGAQHAGYHTAHWVAKDLPSGIYFYRLTASDPASEKPLFSRTRKMILLR